MQGTLLKNEVALSSGMVALIDEDDRVLVDQYQWFYDPKGYAATTIPRADRKQTLYMHRLILLGSPDKAFSLGRSVIVDHRNGNGLDNRRCNVRQCTQSQNGMNRGACVSTSRYKGVSVSARKRGKKWCAYIGRNGKTFNLGSFDNEEDAAIAYNVAAQMFFGDFAYLNDV